MDVVLESFRLPSAVVGDVIDVVRDTQYHCTGRISCTCYRTTPVKNFKNVKNKFFLRMQVENKPGVLASIAMVFGVHKVSITKVMQKEQCENADVAELVIVTEAVQRKPDAGFSGASQRYGDNSRSQQCHS